MAMTTGMTSGGDVVITGDTNAIYNIKIGLTSEMQDMGFFDAYPFSGVTGTTNDDDYGSYSYIPYVVTGGSVSRLNELRKYVTGGTISQIYITGGTYFTDGVDYANTVQNVKITYYLGGVKFVDTLTGASSGTTFSFTGLGITSPDFINVPIYKNPAKENIISNPKINDDVFIVRQELSAFENNYRLEHVKNLSELLTYAGGKYFKIVNNT